MRNITIQLINRVAVLIIMLSFTCKQKAFSELNSKYGKELPNIIYILVDDLGYGSVNLNLEKLEAFNNPALKTPHLSKFADQSKVFTHHYAASPVCSPSRAGLLTGRTPSRLNIHNFINDKKDNGKHFLHGNEVTVAEILKEKGYNTAVFGKWHLNGADWEDPESWNGWTGSYPKQQGFDDGIVSKENPHYTRLLAVNTQKHPGDFFTVDGKPVGPMKGYTSDILTNSAIEWMNLQQKQESPFFLYLSYDAVHIRIMAGDKFMNLYNTGDARKDEFYGNITHLDDAIGNLLQALDEAGIEENTIVFFSSDNGPPPLRTWDASYFCYGTSYPLYGQKFQLYEGGLRVLGMVRWPGKIKPGISDEPNSTLDVLPTLAALTGASLPSNRQIDGENILPHLLHDKQIRRKQPMYWQYEYHKDYNNPQGYKYERRQVGRQTSDVNMLPHVKIRIGDYVMYGLSDKKFTTPSLFRLYHLKNDPEEQNDLTRKNPELYEEMKEKLLLKYKSVREDQLKTKGIIKIKNQ